MMIHFGLMRFAEEAPWQLFVQQATKPPKKHKLPKMDETAIIHVVSIFEIIF
jgi:hypothetical protein